MRTFSFTPIVIALITSAAAVAQSETSPDNNSNDMETIEVKGQSLSHFLQSSLAAELRSQGVTMTTGGGVSGLPVLNGLMGDRIQVLNDGVPVTASCGNQMNPPLSYFSANQVTAISTVAAISPVSMGGDNIAGIIAVDTLSPQFAASAELEWHGGLSISLADNDNRQTTGGQLTVSNQAFALQYTGQQVQADSYQDGHGGVVMDTLYKAQNHALSIAGRDQTNSWLVGLNHQLIPYQGFANQYMDMTDNSSTAVQAKYARELNNGEVSAQLSFRDVSHEMGFFSAEKVGMMPMNTESTEWAAKLRWQIIIGNGDQWLIGLENFAYQLDDWWPSVPGSMMMGPNDYHNIMDGERGRNAVYIEWTQSGLFNWQQSAGVRFERVSTDIGQVQSYSNAGMGGMMANPDPAAAMAFNLAEHDQSDDLIDLTYVISRQINTLSSIEFGVARKNRAPNLYERYSWGRSAMATSMIGWFGDGNGYVGNPELRPETAHHFASTYRYSDSVLQAKVSIWYSEVNDYVDTVVIGSFNRSGLPSGQRNILQFQNLDATLYGASIQTNVELADNRFGKWQWRNQLEWQTGEQAGTEYNLYQMVPLKNAMQLRHEQGAWQSQFEWQWTSAKHDVDTRRFEPTTEQYSLLNVSTQYSWQHWQLNVAITNVFDDYYELPMGGVSVADFRNDASAGFQAIAGQGRSMEIGLQYRF